MATARLDIEELRQSLGKPERIVDNEFALLKNIACLVNSEDDQRHGQEMVLRALDNRQAFKEFSPILDALVRQIGLYPYLDPEPMGIADRIAHEVYRANQLGEEVVFHRKQAAVYWSLLAGENVVLSAPTNFGKSLVVDAVLASGKYTNVLIVVPTIALIDETRRRITRRFRDQYRVITHASQARESRNIFIFTQERCIEADLKTVDFFVIDEFYKLGPSPNGEDDRCMLLNQVLYRLLKTKAQFYMLGPNIQGLTEESSGSLKYTGFVEDFRTVVSELHFVGGKGSEYERLVALCKTLNDPTIIFCRSPKRCADVAKMLIEAGVGGGSNESREASEWSADHFHPEWHFARALAAGIGIHHSRVPRALAQYVVRGFNGGELQWLVCTSTLIEGVNTKAKNIIVLDDRINKQKIDLFTFNNIQGRSGRMGNHFVGRVYLFHPPPVDELPFVELPVFTQSDRAPESLLIQLDEEDLTRKSKDRLKPFREQNLISYATLRKNNGIDLGQQLALARELSANREKYSRQLTWGQNYPTYKELLFVCQLMWKFFDGRKLASGSVMSAEQLAVLVNKLRNRPTTKEMIVSQMKYSDDADDAVSKILDFVRLWATFHFPRLLMAIERIQRDVFSRAGVSSGNFEFFATNVESLFWEPPLLALEEFGLPIEVTRKLEARLNARGDLDDVLKQLKHMEGETLKLSSFERRLFDATRRDL